MKLFKLSCTLNYLVLIFSLCIFTSININAQDDTTIIEVENFISIDNISAESEKINQRIHDYRNILVPSGNVHDIDSLIIIATKDLNLEKDSILKELVSISRRDLKVRKVEWRKYRSNMKGYQGQLNDRTAEVIEINDALISEIKKWELTKKEFIKNSNTKDIFDNLDKIIHTLQEVLLMATTRLEGIYSVEKRLTELILISDELIAEIKNTELELKKDYFIFDSQPIWKVQDSLLVEDKINEIEKGSFKEQLSNNKSQLIDFFSSNMKISIFQLLFIFFIFFLLTMVRNKWIIKLDELTNPVEIQAKIVLKHHIAATVVVGVLLSAFFYDELIPIVSELFVTLLLISTLILLPKLTNQKFLLFITCLFGVYLIYLGESYIENNLLLSRILLLIESVVLILGLRIGKRTINQHPEDFVRIHKLFVVITPLYLAFLFGAILANIIGMVGLSRFLFYGVLTSSVLLVIIYLSVKVITSIVVLIFKLRKSYGLHAVSTIVHATHKRIQPILFWTGMLVWLIFTLKGFDALDFISAWIDELLHLSWAVGKITISLGGIISFTLIFVFTLLIAKLAASIFQDEWMVTILPRGIAPAISLMLRIFLISIGFYIALSSVGLNLSKLGFIIGALGVGIGFGLQGIVLNFIAGLILAFERPINIGDAIEVDGEFGVVTNIGLRSSHIKTYGGYEAIIPNGDLISKKVVNWTLSNRDRRSEIIMKTAPNANPNEVIELFNKIASNHLNTFDDPAPKTYFKGYDDEGNLSFQLLYWSTFSDTLKNDHEIGLAIFDKMKEVGIQPPAPVRRIMND